MFSCNTLSFSKQLSVISIYQVMFLFILFVSGGFLDFQASHPSLCETKSCCPNSSTTPGATGSSGYKYPTLTSLSQPCLPSSNVGPTKILPYLYLGSQQDALSEETIKVSTRPTIPINYPIQFPHSIPPCNSS